MDSTRAPLALIRGERDPVISSDIGKAGHVGLADRVRTPTPAAATASRSSASSPTALRVEERIVVPQAQGASHPYVGSINTRRYAFVAWTERHDGVSKLPPAAVEPAPLRYRLPRQALFHAVTSAV
jgi:hypothetical protein